MSVEQVARRIAIVLAGTALVLLVVGLAWPTPPTGSCGNDLRPPPGAPHGKIYTLFVSGVTGAAAAMASVIISGGGANRRLKWTLLLAGSAITVVGLGGSFIYSFPPCGLY
jgi:hypothetical protein